MAGSMSPLIPGPQRDLGVGPLRGVFGHADAWSLSVRLIRLPPCW
jgi:hypothetical protein